jgi:hypothetical protein
VATSHPGTTTGVPPALAEYDTGATAQNETKLARPVTEGKTEIAATVAAHVSRTKIRPARSNTQHVRWRTQDISRKKKTRGTSKSPVETEYFFPCIF